MTWLGEAKTAEAAAHFLEEAARYFDRRPTGGEDSAYWANTYNAQNARNAAALMREHDGLERALRVRIWNECKERGMRDEDAYKRINAAIEAVKTEARAASAIEAQRAATGNTDAVEDESAVAKPDAQEQSA